MTSHESGPAAPPAGGARRAASDRVIALVNCTAAGVVWSATSALPAILPDVGRELEASQADLQWISDVYPIVLAALLVPAGAIPTTAVADRPASVD